MEVSHHAELDYKPTEREGFDVDLMGVSCGVEAREQSWMQGFQKMEILRRTVLPWWNQQRGLHWMWSPGNLNKHLAALRTMLCFPFYLLF